MDRVKPVTATTTIGQEKTKTNKPLDKYDDIIRRLDTIERLLRKHIAQGYGAHRGERVTV